MAPYSKYHPVKSSSRRKYILIALSVVLAAGILFGTLEKTGTINLIHGQDISTPQTTDGINYGPPTKQDAKAVEERKEAIIKDQENQKPPATTPTPATTAKKSIKPVIVNASATTVRSFVPGVVENGGTCTATLTKAGAATITKTAAASPDAQNTNCIIDITGSGAGAGWKVTVSYSSTTTEGTSDAFDI